MSADRDSLTPTAVVNYLYLLCTYLVVLPPTPLVKCSCVCLSVGVPSIKVEIKTSPAAIALLCSQWEELSSTTTACKQEYVPERHTCAGPAHFFALLRLTGRQNTQ